MTLEEAARDLGLSRIRTQKLVEQGLLPAEQAGGRWFVDARDLERRRLVAEPRGRPLSDKGTWNLIASGPLGGEDEQRDAMRRRLRRRAAHVDAYLLPELLEKLVVDDAVLLGGRYAAEAEGMAVSGEPDGAQLYMAASTLEQFEAWGWLRRRAGIGEWNTIVHVVDDDLWDHVRASWPKVRLTLAWLDLADVGDRAARLVAEELWRRS